MRHALTNRRATSHAAKTPPQRQFKENAPQYALLR